MRKKRAILNIIFGIVLQFATILSGLIIPKLIISSFGTNVNGLISSATQFLSYITLLEAGIGGVARAALYRPLSTNDNKKIVSIIFSIENFFKKIAKIFLIYLLLLAVLFKFISNSSLDYLTTFTLVVIIGISSFIQYYFGISYQVLLQADQKQYITTMIQIFTIILNTIITYILIKLGFDIIAVKIISTIVLIIRPIAINIYVKRKYKINLNNISEPYNLKQKYDGLAHHIAYFLHTNTDIVIITIFLNVSYVSVYSIYNMIALGLKNLTVTFSSGIEAAFGNMIANNETDNLKEKFEIVEFVNSSISIIAFFTGHIMIENFIDIYTKGITDFNYHIPVLGYCLLLSEFIYCIRQPFHSMAMALGDFIKTKKAAWIETFINIILSLILVQYYGIFGVVIATVIAMSYRTIYYVFYLNKNIIYRKKRIFFINRFVTFLLIGIIGNILHKNVFVTNVDNYLSWVLKSISVGISITIITFIVSMIFYRKQLKYIFNSIIKKRKIKIYKLIK